MLRSIETASKERLRRREVAADGADGKLQRLIWDPGGFPTA
jgi:hypothetical protein